MPNWRNVRKLSDRSSSLPVASQKNLPSPNAGKSTITNNFVGSKVSIVSPKEQTTRTMVKGIGIYGNTQIIFLDTPGIFKPKRRLDRAMVASAWGGVGDADITVLVVDAHKGVDLHPIEFPQNWESIIR